MTGWLVLYGYGAGEIMPKYYRTEKQAVKYANEHNAHGEKYGKNWKAVVVNVEDLVAWVDSGVAELERMFRL